MILGFSTQLNGKPTYFVEKIWNSFDVGFAIDNFPDYFDLEEGYQFNDEVINWPAKLHTIREDKKDRWNKGNKIDFFINVRKKDMFRFAPVLPVVSIQKIQIVYYDKTETKWEFPHLKYAIRIDNRRLEPNEIKELAENDGFDTIDDLLAFFPEDFKGKIIHWTDKRY